MNVWGGWQGEMITWGGIGESLSKVTCSTEVTEQKENMIT